LSRTRRANPFTQRQRPAVTSKGLSAALDKNATDPCVGFYQFAMRRGFGQKKSAGRRIAQAVRPLSRRLGKGGRRKTSRTSLAFRVAFENPAATDARSAERTEAFGLITPACPCMNEETTGIVEPQGCWGGPVERDSSAHTRARSSKTPKSGGWSSRTFHDVSARVARSCAFQPRGTD